MKYSEIQSPYIRKKLEETSWENREYIHDLLKLYEWIRNPPQSLCSIAGCGHMQSRLHEDWLALLREYSEKAYQEHIEWEAENNRRRDKARKLRQAREEAERQAELEDWLKAGGKA